ncbi:MAG: hypothetical protein V1753_01135 [Pseudomonadota bacterium]
MLNTYKAILTGDRLEWREKEPICAAENRSVAVYVTILKDRETLRKDMTCGPKMADALEKLATMDSLGISDPSAWQREIRNDRSLPQRNG